MTSLGQVVVHLLELDARANVFRVSIYESIRASGPEPDLGALAWPWYVPLGTLIAVATGTLASVVLPKRRVT